MVILGLSTARTISASSSRQDGLEDIFLDSLQAICCTDLRKSCATDADGEEGAQNPQQAASHNVPCAAKGEGCKCSFSLVNLPPNWMLLAEKMEDAGRCFSQITISSVCSWSAALGAGAGCRLQLWACRLFSAGLLGPSKSTALGRPFCYGQQEGVRPCKQNPFFQSRTTSHSWTKTLVHLSNQLNYIY